MTAPADHRTVGLLADPGLAAELAHRLADDLPGRLGRHAGGTWEVEAVEASLELDGNGALPVVEIGRKALDEQDADDNQR